MSTIAGRRRTTSPVELHTYWKATSEVWDELAKGKSREVASEKRRRLVGFFVSHMLLMTPAPLSGPCRTDCKRRALSQAVNSMAPTGFHRVALGSGYTGTEGRNAKGTKAPNMLVSLSDALATRRQLYAVDEYFTSQRCPRVCVCVCVCVCPGRLVTPPSRTHQCHRPVTYPAARVATCAHCQATFDRDDAAAELLWLAAAYEWFGGRGHRPAFLTPSCNSRSACYFRL